MHAAAYPISIHTVQAAYTAARDGLQDCSVWDFGRFNSAAKLVFGASVSVLVGNGSLRGEAQDPSNEAAFGDLRQGANPRPC